MLSSLRSSRSTGGLYLFLLICGGKMAELLESLLPMPWEELAFVML